MEKLLATAAIATSHVCYPRLPLRAHSLWSLQGAKSQQELAKLVAENLLAFDPKFWLRMATRADAAESREEKDRLTALANTVMTIVDTIVARTNTQVCARHAGHGVRAPCTDSFVMRRL